MLCHVIAVCAICRAGVRPDLLATSGDHLRIWNIQESQVVLDRLLTNVSEPGIAWLVEHTRFCFTN
jgi:hypothetical protein